MAVTGFWPVKGQLKAVLDYADNPDKTTPQRYLDSDLYDTLKYAANDAKTDRTMFVAGINCSKQNAYGEMLAVQKRFGNRGSVVAYHGIQSFRAGEVTPEMAFEIGKETARRMWGDRYQVLVTVHLNTENVHCHFVVNPVSFQDGSKFQNKIGDHKELRKISDAICREHGLSVLENSDFYKHEKKAYWLHRQGKKTHRDTLREDVEYCLTYAKNWEQFEKQMVSRVIPLTGYGFLSRQPIGSGPSACPLWGIPKRHCGVGLTRISIPMISGRSGIPTSPISLKNSHWSGRWSGWPLPLSIATTQKKSLWTRCFCC